MALPPKYVFSVPDLAALEGHSYVGNLATRGLICSRQNATAKHSMSKSVHVARSPFIGARFRYENWWVDGGIGEKATGAPATIEAWIEYPQGEYTRLTFAGSQVGTIPNGGSLESDPLSITIPAGAIYYEWVHLSNPLGVISNYAAKGLDRVKIGDTATTEMLEPGDPLSAAVTIYCASAVIGRTTKPSVFLIETERGAGYNESRPTAGGDTGGIGRAVGPAFAYTRGTIEADTLEYLAAPTSGYPFSTFMKRRAVADYHSHIVVNLGFRDLQRGRIADELYSWLVSLCAYFAPKPVFIGTIAPMTASTDAWSTVAGQTPSGYESQRVTINRYIRRGIPGAAGVIDSARAVETGFDSGLWIPGSTSDGVVENDLGAGLQSTFADVGRIAR